MICLKCGGKGRVDHRGMKRVVCCVIASALIAPLNVAWAQGVGDPSRGLSLAQQVCSECHDVQVPKSRSPNPAAAPFADLAAIPGMTATALTIALTTPHAGMPMFKLDDDQRTDLIAYILGLARGEGGLGR